MPDGTRLRLCERGEGDRVVVLVHGWKMSHRVFDRAIELLQRRCRVIAYDLRGMGESDKPVGPYNFGVHAADLQFLLHEFQLEDVTLVGWSMGCTVSLEYVRRYGDRIARLVLVNGPIKLTQAPDFPWTMTDEVLDRYVHELAASWPEQERQFTREAFHVANEDTVEWIYHIALQTPLPIVLEHVREQRQLDFRDFLPKIRVPVLALYGRHDPYYPVELADYIAERVPRGERSILDSGHFVFHEESERFVELVTDFAEGR